MKHNSRNIIIGSLVMFVLLALTPMTSSFAFGTSGTMQANSIQAQPMAVQARDISLGPDTPTCGSTEICPALMDNAYNFTGLHNEGVNGSGQSIAIVDSCEETSIASDLKAFDSFFHLPNPKFNIYYPQGKCTENYGWGPEIAIDVEWSHALAPAAAINLVVAKEPTFADLFGAWKYVYAHNLGQEISNSWGSTSPTACPSSINTLLATLAAANITVTASTGDSGAWATGYGQTPANCLGVLGIGGTSLDISSSGKYVSESAWSGAGGGYASAVKEPSFQSMVNIKDPSKKLGRADVSADADPSTGIWIYDSPDEGGWSCCWGGTSVSNVLWAGFMGDVNQIRVTNGFATAGYVNPFLYLWVYGVSGTSPLYKTNLHDVKTGSDGFPATKGWDPPTGLGTFIANNLAWTIGDNSTA